MKLVDIVRPRQVWMGLNPVTGMRAGADVINVMGDEVEVRFRDNGKIVTISARQMLSGRDGWNLIEDAT
jgi:hypothetical protein